VGTITGERRGNLPAQVSRFVGRRDELAGLRSSLAASRLVTLVGPGGVGKTRLALRAAEERRRSYRDGVWLVELADLDAFPHTGLHGDSGTGAAQPVARAVLGVLGLREQPGQPPAEQLAEHLRTLRPLLVLDNCEHLLDRCGALAAHLLAECPDLRLLATSREPLDVAGEVVRVVPPLALPELAGVPSPRAVSDSDAVSLFVDRAAAVVPGFHLTGDNHVAVAEVCHRLEGLPLAIELAAARVVVLSPEQLRERLADRFHLLTRGSRVAPERHRTLTASLEWSFALCTPEERHVWSGLGVFLGGCEADAAGAVCDDDVVPPAAVPGVLAALAGKSVLSVEEYAFGTRYRMLESVREYAAMNLHSAGRHAGARRRHAGWCEDLVHRLDREWISERQQYWLVRMPLELPNLRTALDTRLAAGDGEAALRVLVSIPPALLWARDLLGEMRGWAARALALVPGPVPLRARGVVLAAQLAIAQGDLAAAAPLLAEGQELARRTQDAAALAFAGYAAGTLAMSAGDAAGALAHFGAALAACGALPTLNQRLDLLLASAVAAGLAGDEPRAAACHEEIVAITEPAGERFNRSNSLWALGISAWRQRDAARAADLQRRAIRLKRQIDDRLGVATSVEALAWATAPSDPERAATMLGGLAALTRTTRTAVDASQHQFAEFRAECLRDTRAALGEAAFEAATERGRAMSPREVVAYCLGGATPVAATAGGTVPAPPVGPDPLDELSPRERQVAELVGAGLSNKEIAAAIFLSRRTVEAHVQRTLVKLGFTSRAQIAALIVARQP
jgi:predicted ATPase/DNA-binding CsgD family transcriptional regulator